MLPNSNKALVQDPPIEKSMLHPCSSCNLQNPEFFMPWFNTVKFGKYSIRYLGPVLWNKLSKKVRMCKSIIEFKIAFILKI